MKISKIKKFKGKKQLESHKIKKIYTILKL